MVVTKRQRGVCRMTDTEVYYILSALIAINYLIALRCRNMARDISCIHDFVHSIGEHPILTAFLGEIEVDIRAMENSEDSEEVPAAFKQWDES